MNLARKKIELKNTLHVGGNFWNYVLPEEPIRSMSQITPSFFRYLYRSQKNCSLGRTLGLSSVKTWKISGLSHICIGTIEQSPRSMGSMLDLVVGCDLDPGSNVGMQGRNFSVLYFGLRGSVKPKESSCGGVSKTSGDYRQVDFRVFQWVISKFQGICQRVTRSRY